VGAASTTPRRVGTARQPGPGKQDGEVYERRNQWWNPLKSVGPAGNLVDGRESSAPDSLTTREKGLGGVRAGGHGEGLRRSRGHACRGKAGHRSRRPVCGERGNRLLVANLPISQIGSGKARRLLMTRRRGGGSVVVRSRESRLHGEGTQRACSSWTGRAGGRR
jgi:hypothetical protein